MVENYVIKGKASAKQHKDIETMVITITEFLKKELGLEDVALWIYKEKIEVSK